MFLLKYLKKGFFFGVFSGMIVNADKVMQMHDLK